MFCISIFIMVLMLMATLINIAYQQIKYLTKYYSAIKSIHIISISYMILTPNFD